MSFSSTEGNEACVMNMITHASAYSLYPVCTFIERQTLVCGAIHEKATNALDKYNRRGWTAVHAIPIENFQSAADELKMRTRWLGDNRCWIIKVKGEKNDSTMDIEGNNISWRIRLIKYDETDKFVPKMDFKDNGVV